uniref:Protein phosphatase 1, regulatory (inhibitor) subunit 14Ba n=1 Tax=Poecilia mexicana TaxID=48701 RepID=A0A3B3Y9R7_9TELE
MASEPGTQSRVMFQAPDKTEDPAHRKLGKLTVKYNRKDLQRRLDIEEWIDGQLHLLFDCEEEEIPELEIDIDELLELPDEGQRTRLEELLQECGKPKEEFINGLLYRIKGLRKMLRVCMPGSANITSGTFPGFFPLFLSQNGFFSAQFMNSKI